MILQVERGGSMMRSHASRTHLPEAPTPASAPPRSSRAQPAALAPKCVTGTGRVPPAARARLARGQRGPGQGCPADSGAGTRAWKTLRLRCPRRAVGGALRGRQRARSRPPQSLGARGYTFPSPPPRFLPRGRSGDFLSGKLRGSFPGLLAPPQFPAPSSLLGSRCWPTPGRRLWQPGPGGGRGPWSRWLPPRPAM